jgi:cytochrome P450
LEPFVAVADLEQGRAMVREHGANLVSRPWPATAEVSGGFLRTLRDDAHRRVRRSVGAPMRSDLVALNEASLRAIARTGLTRLADEDPIAQRVTLRDTAEAWLALILFGIAADDPLFQQLRAALPAPEDPDRTPQVAVCRPGATASAMTLLRAGGFRSATGACVTARIAATDGSPPDDAALGNLVMMLQVGAFDLSSLLRWLLHYLADHPPVLARLRAAGPTDRAALARACVQETLRLDQSEALMRTATADIGFAGCTIPKGWGVRICLREAHRDPARFDRPHAFRPERFLDDAPSSAAYAPFGLGAHTCVAAELVVELARLLVEELVEGFDLAIAADGPRVLGAYHWEPHPSFAVRVEPITV